MKTLRIIMIFILFSSCSKDGNDNPEIEKNASILGTWYYSFEIRDGVKMSYVPGQGDGNDDCAIIDDYIVIEGNGNYNRYYFEYCELILYDDTRYEKDGNKFRLYNKESGKLLGTANITALNETTLTLDFIDLKEIDSLVMEFER